MKIEEIIKDSIKYPFSDWKKVLILGIIVMLTTLNYTFQSLGMGIFSLSNLGIFGLIFGLLVYGYGIKILKSSLNGFAELPEFNGWLDILINGFKVIVVSVGYTIPLILILVFSGLFLGFIAGIMEVGVITSFLWIIIIMAFLYLIIIFPIFLLSLANMEFYNGDLGAAFKFREIFNKISNIGWGKFVTWYIITVIICLGLIFAWGVIGAIFNLISLKIVGTLLGQLILLPYLTIFVFRSVALIYPSKSQEYLECENCGGYYKLQPGESPEDFSKCQCGGKLKYVEDVELIDESKDKKQSLSENLRSLVNKRNLIIIGLLSLIIVVISIISTENVIVTNSTIIGTYNVSDIGQDPYGTVVNIPQGTTKITIEYNLSWTPVSHGTNGIIIDGYNTNVTVGPSITQFNGNVIYDGGFQLHEDDQNKTGTLQINKAGLKSLVISQNGVKGTIKIYAYQTKLAI